MPKGFGSLTPERRREISSSGGKAAHARGTAHRFSTEEAKAAGRIGGLKARKRGLAMAFLESGPQGAPVEPEPKGMNGPGDLTEPNAEIDAMLHERGFAIPLGAPNFPIPAAPTERPYVYHKGYGWWFRTEDEGERGPFPTEGKAQEEFDRYCAEVLSPKPTEPPPPAPPTEPAPPLVVEETTVGPAHPDFDPQAALDAAEIQRVHDEAMARS